MSEARVFLVRHGGTSRTTGSATSADRVGGWSNDPLTAAGRQDALRAARALAEYPIQRVLSSDLRRGEQTATIIARAHGAKRQSSPAFRSWQVGELAGKPFREAAPVMRQLMSECPSRPAPGGQSFEQFKARALPAVLRVLAAAKAAGETVVLVTHTRVATLILGWIAAGCRDGVIDPETFMRHDLGPGSMVELQPAAGKWTAHVLSKGSISGA